MIKIEYFILLCVATCTVVFGIGDMGEGRWRTVSVDQCDDDDGEFEWSFNVTRRKHNRTLDVFDVTFSCDRDIDDSVGTLITICKHVDGGCKEWQILSDDSVPRFAKKYAESNMKRAFDMAQIDPPNFPLKAGEYSMKGFALDYCEFPKDCVYGRFTSVTNLILNGKKMTCMKITTEFDEDTEGYECD